MHFLSKLMLSTLVSLSALQIHAETEQTRYGTFEIKRLSEYESDILYFDGKQVKPLIEGNNSLNFAGRYKLQKDDVVVVQDNGGTACPAQFYLLKVSPSKRVTVSPMFGTCSDLIKIKASTKQLVITMPQFQSLYEESQTPHASPIKYITYTYDGQVIRENGKILKLNQ